MKVNIFIKEEKHKHHHKRVVLMISFDPFQPGRISIMAGTITAPQGAVGTATLAPVPSGASFVGAPTIVSSDSSVVAVSDNGNGTASLSVVGTVGQSAVITGTDTGNGFTDSVTVTVGPSGPPAETGVTLTVTFP